MFKLRCSLVATCFIAVRGVAGSEPEPVKLFGSVRWAVSWRSLAWGWPVLNLNRRTFPVRFGGHSVGQVCRFEFIAAKLKLESVLLRGLDGNRHVYSPVCSEPEPLNLPVLVRGFGVNCLLFHLPVLLLNLGTSVPVSGSEPL
jgi:hypothetical protein